MKTWVKIVLGLIVIGIGSIVACVAIDLSSDPDPIIPADEVEYHTKEELIDLYWQNKTVLNSVKDIVLSNDGMIQELNDFNEGDNGILTDHSKSFFSQEEWHNIVSVFENLRVNMLMLERKGRPLIFYITFTSQKQNNITKSTYLYWFPNDDERAYHEEDGVFPDGVFTQIDDGWYIVEAEETR